MDFLAASQNVDNSNTNKVPCYMSICLSNSTQTQTHEIQNQEAFSIKDLSDRKRKHDSSVSFHLLKTNSDN